MVNFFERLIKKEKPPEKIREISPGRERDAEKLFMATPEEITLECQEIQNIEVLWGGRETTVFVQFKDDGAGIFKPEVKERHYRTHATAGTQFKRERAAYLIDKFLGFGLVPPTVIREINGEKGSLQQFVPTSDAKMACELDWSKERDNKYLHIELMKLWIFDYIIYSSDRHSYNLLINIKNYRVYAIDNGLTFGHDPILTFREFFNVPIPNETMEHIKEFLSREDIKKGLEDLLLSLLSVDEVKACLKRIERISQIIEKFGAIPLEAMEELKF